MTVAELIEQLSAYPAEMKVKIFNDDRCASEDFVLEFPDHWQGPDWVDHLESIISLECTGK